MWCYLFGHKWVQTHYTDAPKGWFYEWSKCTRCGELSRELVAGKLG